MSEALPFAVFLMGPTASGKTDLALELVQRFPFEIISVDSALVYRDMNIGTAKPDPATLARAPHRLIDICDPVQAYSAGHFVRDAPQAMAEIVAAGRIPLLVGGTMLYFKALRDGLNDLPVADQTIRESLDREAAEKGWPVLHAELARVDPETAARLSPNDSQRIQRALEVFRVSGQPLSALIQPQAQVSLPYRVLPVGLMPGDRSVLHGRIARRFDVMLQSGFVEEVADLRQRYPLYPEMPSMRCVGYRQVWQYLDGELDKAAMREKGIIATRQLAKRQMTWLRAMTDIKIMDCLAPDLAKNLVEWLACRF